MCLNLQNGCDENFEQQKHGRCWPPVGEVEIQCRYIASQLDMCLTAQGLLPLNLIFGVEDGSAAVVELIQMHVIRNVDVGGGPFLVGGRLR